jgi:hypothetical protein
MEKKLESLKELLAIQGCNGNWNYDQYMRGMYNGMELVVAVLEGCEPIYRDDPKKASNNWFKRIFQNRKTA